MTGEPAETRKPTERELDEMERDLERVVQTHQKHLDNFRERRKGKQVNGNNNGSHAQESSPKHLS